MDTGNGKIFSRTLILEKKVVRNKVICYLLATIVCIGFSVFVLICILMP